MPNGNVGTFQKAYYEDLSLQSIYNDFKQEISIEQCMQLLIEMQREEVWKSEYYQVAVDKTPKHGFRGFTIWHLSIKRLDKEPIHDWRDLMSIKNQLVGPEFEAIELYPAESRKVDSANQHHLWVFHKDPKRKRAPQFPIGWTTRYTREDDIINGKQRKFHRAGVFDDEGHPTLAERDADISTVLPVCRLQWWL